MQTASAPLTTTALCQATGATRGMLRLYEREGLLALPPRTAAGYRHYPANTVERLQAIRHLKELGFGLKDIAMLLNERDALRMDPKRLRAMAREQVRRIDERLARLQVVRDYVNAVAKGDRALLEDPECGFLLRFLGAGIDHPTATPPRKASAVSRKTAQLVRTG